VLRRGDDDLDAALGQLEDDVDERRQGQELREEERAHPVVDLLLVVRVSARR
jgi:hypothetical protein